MTGNDPASRDLSRPTTMNNNTLSISSLIGLLGPPRSGTTLIANAMASHSSVAGLLEPYQSRRSSGYQVTEVSGLVNDFNLSLDGKRHLLVKETTTRRINVTHTLSVLESARRSGLYAGIVVILRCPFSAYLSQVEASEKFWKEKKLLGVNESTFASFASGIRTGLLEVARKAKSYHFRLVSYEAFVASPANELSRLMALLPERLERKEQLAFRPPGDISGAGDPKVWTKSGGLSSSDRGEQILQLKDQFRDMPEFVFMDKLRNLIVECVCTESDEVVLDELTLLLLKA